MDRSTDTSDRFRAADARAVRSLFGAITSAMQPARMPLALLAALFLSAFTPLVDLAGQHHFGERGLSSTPLAASERDFAYQRARAAVSRVASTELAAREDALKGEDGVPVEELSLSALRSIVREGTQNRIEERRASEGGLDEAEERRLRDRAVAAMKSIEAVEQRGIATVFFEAEGTAARKVLNGLASLDLEQCLAGILGGVFTVPATAVRSSPMVVVLAFLVMLCVLTFLSGGLCRMAAVHAGRASRLTPQEGATFARQRALNLVSIPVLPVIVLALLAVIVALFAVFLRIPVLNLVAGALFVVPALVGLLIAVLALVAIVSFPLMPAAVAVEDCDAGDAITRAGALVLARPLVWLAVLATSIAVLALGGVLVQGILQLASGAVSLSLAALGGVAGQAIASGDEAEVAALYGPDLLVGSTVWFWSRLFGLLGGAYIFSLLCDLATRSYLLMRARIDGESPATISGYGIR
ncbi:MAG: hypothetical protein QM516_02660 [Limnohabitans sp.]|nr:hypothetical protein [Limnohabitans sp.]